jgi:hypothetical protein
MTTLIIGIEIAKTNALLGCTCFPHLSPTIRLDLADAAS